MQKDLMLTFEEWDGIYESTLEIMRGTVSLAIGNVLTFLNRKVLKDSMFSIAGLSFYEFS